MSVSVSVGVDSILEAPIDSSEWCVVEEQDSCATPFATLTEERKLVSTSCEWISPNRVRVGKMEITNVAIYFIDESNQLNVDATKAQDTTSTLPIRLKNRRWPLDKLQRMLRRRYVSYTCLNRSTTRELQRIDSTAWIVIDICCRTRRSSSSLPMERTFAICSTFLSLRSVSKHSKPSSKSSHPSSNHRRTVAVANRPQAS
jgi:hypothetical protein